LANWRQVASGLLAEGYAVAIIGLPADKALGRELAEAHRASRLHRSHGLHPKSVRELVALLATPRCWSPTTADRRSFLTLTAVPTVALFGPETPLLYGPARRARELPASRTALLALPHCLQPPQLALRRRQPVPAADRAGEQVLAEARIVVARAHPQRRQRMRHDAASSGSGNCRCSAALLRHRFVKFGVVGASGTVVNVAVLYLAQEILFQWPSSRRRCASTCRWQ
jgi:hypothetical protein